MLLVQSVNTIIINTQRRLKMTSTKNVTLTDEAAFMQTALIKTLTAAARGEIDLNRLAREELVSRGLDANGQWVGFAKAKEIHNV
jgi:hypothetical protein